MHAAWQLSEDDMKTLKRRYYMGVFLSLRHHYYPIKACGEYNSDDVL
jgi:hypothetical protein